MQFALNDYKNELLCSESIDTCSRVPIPKINDNENYIFISYSHKDYKYVFSDLADMYSSKVRFWYDKGLTAGKSWDDEVADIIEDSRCVGVVFYLSENFFLSDSIFREVQFVCEVKRKNFFCVNLTTDNIESLIDRNVLENERKAFYHQHFQQKKTYLVYKSVDHYHELIEQIANQYNVVSNKIEFENGIYHGALVNGRRNGHGVCIYSDGSRYDGEWENDKWNGYGEYLYSNGDIYRGNWINGERHGDGELTLVSSGESYKGSYKEDLFDGYGIYRWENAKESEKKEYCGYYCEGKHHGKGKMIYADGSYYDGEWVDGKKQGHGTNTYSNGAIYIGEFHNNKRNGKGKYTYTNGDIYDGEWLKGDRTGNGTMNYANGDIYTGKWGRNKYNGYGTYIWANPQDNDPEKYEGYFLNGERDGQGRITYPGGGYYDGNWKQGWRSGYGECLRGNGDKYCGEWLKGDYHGKGTMLYANGEKYEGEWTHDKKEGQGTFTYADGNIFVGVWKDNLIFEGTGYNAYDNGYYIGEIKNFKRNGIGIYTWTDSEEIGKEYSGEWHEGSRHGNGTLLYKNGDKYDGEWVKNNKEGQGIMQYANGDTYSGGWLHDQKHGIGEFCWKNTSPKNPKKHNGNYENDVICGHGSMIYTNGDTYEGEFFDGKRNGTGTYKWYQNTIEKEYTGQWLAGEYHGKGTMLYANGDKYEGEWKHSEKNGNGVVTYADGQKFEGIWENDKKFEGNGYCQYDDSYYIGEIKNGKRNGCGTYVWLNANTANKEYSGEWLDGNYHGKGVMLYRNGDKYDGDWVQDNKEGHGVMQYADGDRYIGEWKHGLKHGLGEFYWESPARTSPQNYNGNYENDVICGHGSMIYANGDTYEGEFLDGKRNGTGIYRWYHNTIEKEYTGQWLAGDYHGNGTMIYSSGDKFEGEWKNNKKEGHGIYTYANGLSFEGTWENDSFYGVDGLHKSIGYIVRFVDNIYAWRIPFYLIFALSCVGIYSDFFEYKFFEFFNFQDIGLQMDYLGIHVLYQCICMIGISIILLLMHKSTVYNKWYYCAIVCSGSVFILGFGFYCIGMLLHMNAYAIVFMGVLYPLYVFFIGHFMTCLIRYWVFKLLKFNKSKK